MNDDIDVFDHEWLRGVQACPPLEKETQAGSTEILHNPAKGWVGRLRTRRSRKEAQDDQSRRCRQLPATRPLIGPHFSSPLVATCNVGRNALRQRNQYIVRGRTLGAVVFQRNSHGGFLYARPGTSHWDKFFDLMVEGNQRWAKNAALLIVVISRETFERNDTPSPTHSYDAGAAWQNFALQGSKNGLVVHGMAGFDYDAAREKLGVPHGYRVEAMIAVGKPGRRKTWKRKSASARCPPIRKPVAEFAFESGFPTKGWLSGGGSGPCVSS